MEAGQMKNIVVLKNLPSNIVEEAIVVLKPNLKIKQIEHIAKTKENKLNANKDYIVREAESVVSNYISNLDKQKEKNSKTINKINEKYNRLRIITFLLSGIILFNVIIKIFS